MEGEGRSPLPSSSFGWIGKNIPGPWGQLRRDPWGGRKDKDPKGGKGAPRHGGRGRKRSPCCEGVGGSSSAVLTIWACKIMVNQPESALKMRRLELMSVWGRGGLGWHRGVGLDGEGQGCMGPKLSPLPS